MIHNVSNRDLIKIQDQCYMVEQLARTGKVKDARNMLKSISSTALCLEKELAKGKIKWTQLRKIFKKIWKS